MCFQLAFAQLSKLAGSVRVPRTASFVLVTLGVFAWRNKRGPCSSRTPGAAGTRAARRASRRSHRLVALDVGSLVGRDASGVDHGWKDGKSRRVGMCKTWTMRCFC